MTTKLQLFCPISHTPIAGRGFFLLRSLVEDRGGGGGGTALGPTNVEGRGNFNTDKQHTPTEEENMTLTCVIWEELPGLAQNLKTRFI